MMFNNKIDVQCNNIMHKVAVFTPDLSLFLFYILYIIFYNIDRC